VKIFKTKMYNAFELGVLKTCVMCVGLIVGAYFSPHVKKYLWVLAALGFVTYVRAMYFYWCDKS